MDALRYSSALITSIVDNPALLSSPTALGISSSDAIFILNAGYTKGFRTVFILNSALTALATMASIVLIKHKDLNRGDENQLRAAASAKKDEIKMIPRIIPAKGMLGDRVA